MKAKRISGQAAVEFAIILPLMAVMFLAGMDIYLAASAHERLSFTARECALFGARNLGRMEESEIISASSKLAYENLGTGAEDDGIRFSMCFDGDTVHVTVSRSFEPVSFAGRAVFGPDRVISESCTASVPPPEAVYG